MAGVLGAGSTLLTPAIAVLAAAAGVPLGEQRPRARHAGGGEPGGTRTGVEREGAA